MKVTTYCQKHKYTKISHTKDVKGIVIEDSNEKQTLPDPDRHSMASFRTVPSNLAPVEHSTKHPSQTTEK